MRQAEQFAHLMEEYREGFLRLCAPTITKKVWQAHLESLPLSAG